MRDLRWDPVHLRLPESCVGGDRFLPMRRRLHLRRDVHLQQLPARERAQGGDAVTVHIGRIVTGCLVGGLVVALALVVGPLAGAPEHVITGTVLLVFGTSW